MNRTRALEHLGRLEESWGDFEAALARYEEALATGEAALRDAAPTPYNRAYLVGALSRLGLVRERLGRTASAREALDRALATARELGTRHLIAQVLLDRGRLARESGDLDSALASHEEALALATSARLEPDEALSLAELGWDALGPGRRGGGARPVRARAPFEGRFRVARDRGGGALRDRAGPREARGARSGRRAGRPGGGRRRVGPPRHAGRAAPPGLLAAAAGRLPQRDCAALPVARGLGSRAARGKGARARGAGPLPHAPGPDQPGCRAGRSGERGARVDGRPPPRGAPRGRHGPRCVRPRRAPLLCVGSHARRVPDGGPSRPEGDRARGARLAEADRVGRAVRGRGPRRGGTAARDAPVSPWPPGSKHCLAS